jgi:hypothetical protein
LLPDVRSLMQLVDRHRAGRRTRERTGCRTSRTRSC